MVLTTKACTRESNMFAQRNMNSLSHRMHVSHLGHPHMSVQEAVGKRSLAGKHKSETRKLQEIEPQGAGYGHGGRQYCREFREES